MFYLTQRCKVAKTQRKTESFCLSVLSLVIEYKAFKT